jgi:hypothetical protein
MVALDVVTRSEPKYFLELMLPWLEGILKLSMPQTGDQWSYGHDVLGPDWHETMYAVKYSLLKSIIDALSTLARTDPESFRSLATRLAASEYETSQYLLSEAYRAVPVLYAEDALAFLLAELRRFDLGSNAQYDTRKLIHAISPYLSQDQQIQLEGAIFSYRPLWKDWGVEGLRNYYIQEFRLLSSVPTDRLSPIGKRRLAELRRKFPKLVIPDSPLLSGGGVVGPPISDDAIQKMSDDAWLGAMAKYRGSVTHRDFLKGGASELASALMRRVKEEPLRFYQLAIRAPDDVDSRYVQAFISGLADSIAPLEHLVDVIRRFVPQEQHDLRATISSALEKRTSAALSNELLDLLEEYAR